MTAQAQDLLAIEQDRSWRSLAACIGQDEIFFSGVTSRPKRICGRCVVREECLEYAIETRPAEGIWAGYEALEIKTIARRRAKRRGVG